MGNRSQTSRNLAALAISVVFSISIYAADSAKAAPRLRGVVETKAGERIEGWIRIEKETIFVEKIDGEDKGKVREITSADLKVATMHVVGNSKPGLKGNYYRDTNFGGALTERVDPVIDFAWGTAAPMPGFPADNYSIRWEGEIETTAAGKYQFHASSDDGVRLWIDNRGVIDRWTNQAETEFSGAINLQGGRRYPIKLEYFEGGSTAALHLRWTPPGAPKAVIPKEKLRHNASPPPPTPVSKVTRSGILGSYFRGAGLGGAAVVRVDSTIDFDWSAKEPLPGFGLNQFSVRWEGEVVGLITGNVTFHTKTDDGVRLSVGGRVLVDQWREMTSAEFQGAIPMESGKRYPIKMEYYQGTGPSEAKLHWSGPNLAKQVIPANKIFCKATGFRGPRGGEGLLLTGGSFLPGAVESADERMVWIALRSGSELRIPKRNIGAILFDGIDQARRDILQKRRPGCVIRGKDDFLESGLVAIQNGEIEMNSPLFGKRKFPWTQVQYLKLNDFEQAAANYELRTKSGALLRADQLIFDGENAMVKDNSLWWIKLDPGDVAVISGSVATP